MSTLDTIEGVLHEMKNALACHNCRHIKVGRSPKNHEIEAAKQLGTEWVQHGTSWYWLNPNYQE